MSSTNPTAATRSHQRKRRSGSSRCWDTKKNDTRSGAGLPKSEKRGPLKESAVLLQTGNAFEKGPQGDRIRPGAVDRGYPDEHGHQERSEERIRDQLLQTD